MKTCVYDNPATYRREGWADGELAWSTAAEAIEQVRALHPSFLRRVPRPWLPGTIVGDAQALPQEIKP